MTYVISDIHGNFEKYEDMLELIHLSDEDGLYVIGDVIDRGPDGIKILKDVMERPNAHMILGNHELMALTGEKRDQVVSVLISLPISMELEVNGQNFHLVHGFPADGRKDQVRLACTKLDDMEELYVCLI
ncbi:MAG: fructose-bisphosphatase class III [Lachnospiraceae bacterium]|nr:fructose-bisphosphatase class III [Lachnospiraceae bacterium]